MKKSLFLLILGVTLFSSHFVFSQWSHHSITHNDLERDYWMYVPSSYGENIPAKIVVTLHGMGDNDTNFRNIGFNLVADTANIIYSITI